MKKFNKEQLQYYAGATFMAGLILLLLFGIVYLVVYNNFGAIMGNSAITLVEYVNRSKTYMVVLGYIETVVKVSFVVTVVSGIMFKILDMKKSKIKLIA